MLTIGTCGPCGAHRYYIHDRDHNYWNGSGWTTNPREAHLWADASEAASKMHDIMLTLPGGLQRFVVPVVIEVKSGEPVSAEALREWLDRAVSVFVDASQGTGPGESMVMLQFGWHKAKETNDGL